MKGENTRDSHNLEVFVCACMCMRVLQTAGGHNPFFLHLMTGTGTMEMCRVEDWWG